MKGTIIGVFGNTMNYSNNAFENVEKQYVNARYISAVELNGGVPLIIPFLKDEKKLTGLLELCDGFLFPGGEDVDPGQYGENPHSRLGEIKPELDEFLIKALKHAIANKIPSMGICKGMQLMTIARGGSLYQDIYDQREEASFLHCQFAKRDYELHNVKIQSDSRLYKILETDSVKTNSMHHQSIKTMGSGMRVAAYAEDGIIEGVESEDGLFIGVQWHPEEMIYSSERMNKLFRNLVNRAQKDRESRR